MPQTWDERIDAFWSRAVDTQPEAALSAMRALADERPDGDPDAVFEWASVHDFLGNEAAAIPHYRAALAAGLAEPRRRRAIIQLASSLRNVGEPRAAVALLQDLAPDDATGSATQAFLALALWDAGEHAAALRTALLALAPTLPMYRRAVEHYAGELDET